MRRTVAVLVVLATACSSTPVPTDTPGDEARAAEYREAAERFTRRFPGSPVAFPTALPSGYRYDRGPVSNLDEVDLFTTTIFEPIAIVWESTRPTVELCVLAPEADPQGLCYADDDSVFGQRTVGGLRVYLVSGDTTAARSLWRGIDFTDDWRSVTWLAGA